MTKPSTIWRSLAMTLAILLTATLSVAQTTLNSTTLAAAVSTAEAATVTLASGTTVAAGHDLYVERERMRILSAVGSSTTIWNVARGIGGTASRPHPNGAKVWTGAPARFGTAAQVSGSSCTTPLYRPVINTTSGRMWECEIGFWMEIQSFSPAVTAWRDFTIRDSFDQGYFIHQDDMTAKSITDDEDNVVYGSPLGIIEYREELGKTASSWLIADGVLDLSADDGATDAEGVEMIFGVAEGTDMGVLVAGTQGGCFAASILLPDISSTDFVAIGWRQNEAFVDNATPASYTLYNLAGIYNSEDGSIFHIETGATSDDSGVNWADGETRALKVCVSKAGVPSAYYSSAYTHSQTVHDFPTWTEIPLGNNGTTLTAGTQLNPFLTFLYGNDTTSSEARVQWVEVTRLP